MDFLKKFETLFNEIIDFVIAIVKAEFPELAKILGSDEEEKA